MTIFKATILLLITFVIASPIFSQDRITDKDEARSIFEEVEERRISVSTETAKMKMVITDNRGRTRTREMRMWASVENDVNSSLIVFENPGNVRGTAFLSVDENGSRNQRLYLPSVGRVQTITSSERGDRFMGSDFTYEDLGDQSADDYEFEWLEETEDQFIIKATKPGSEQYSSVQFFINIEKYTLEEIHYFDDNGEKIKRLISEEFEQITDELWMPQKMTMYDLRDDRNTEISWTEREINVSIPDWRFTERGLRRGI